MITQELTDLAATIAPHLPMLMHPGDGDRVEPFPIALSQFQRAELPEAMRKEDAEQLGLPTPDLNLHVVEAILHLVQTVGGVDLVPHDQHADEQAAAAANETKRNAIKVFCCETCDKALFRVMVKGFDTNRPTVPAAVKAHECRKP